MSKLLLLMWGSMLLMWAAGLLFWVSSLVRWGTELGHRHSWWWGASLDAVIIGLMICTAWQLIQIMRDK